MILDWVNPCAGIQQKMLERDGIRIASFNLGHGVIYHIRANEQDNMMADELFNDYQEQAIDFQRRPMLTKVDPKFLTSQFTHNAGEHYKFHVSMTSQTFAEAAPVITRALELIKSRSSLVTNDPTFNEVLSVAYYESQKM